MQTQAVQLLPGKRWTLRGPLCAPPVLPAAELAHHAGIHPIELPVGVARPEVITPAAKSGSQFRNQLLHILPALPLAGNLPLRHLPGQDFHLQEQHVFQDAPWRNSSTPGSLRCRYCHARGGLV